MSAGTARGGDGEASAPRAKKTKIGGSSGGKRKGGGPRGKITSKNAGGDGQPDVPHLSFTDARTFVRALNLKSSEEWKKYSASGKRPPNITSRPDRVYKEYVLLLRWAVSVAVSVAVARWCAFMLT